MAETHWEIIALTSSIHNPDEVIHIFSSYRLPEMEQLLLCKGFNFAFPPKKFKFENCLF